MTLLDYLRNYLVEEGIVRLPSVAGPLPPLWLVPRDGTPAPGEGTATERGATATIGAFLAGGIPPDPYEAFFRTDNIQFRIRTTTAPKAMEIDEDLRAALVNHVNWDMAGLRVIQCEQFQPFQPTGSDSQSFDWVTSYIFQHYTAPILVP